MQDNYLNSRPYVKFAIVAAIFWTLGTAASLWWNLKDQESAILDAARAAARTAYEKDIVYRVWCAGHGGVYVPISEYAVPNPFLAGFVERDVVTKSGIKLTLINPSYMNRQVHELERTRTGVRGHLTSLKPARPGNAPDDWEREALIAVMAGEGEYSGIQMIDDREYIRLLKPVITEHACLNCHKHGDVAVGMIQGGLSVAIPTEPFRTAVIGSTRALWLWHLMGWIIGLSGVMISTVSLNTHYRRHEKTDKLVRDSLKEKDNLLREIHHRVKNNLQVISGMLELQAVLVKDPAAATSLKNGRNRVMSMALIHQKLYQSGDLALVPMDSYIPSLVDDLFAALNIGEREILVKVDVRPVRLALDAAIPLGLIVSELVSNAIKYAFPARFAVKNAEIVVSFKEDVRGSCFLSVSDNGSGLPDDFDLGTTLSLGLKLVHTLTEQLGGQVTLDRSSGTSWSIICPPYKGADGFVEMPDV